MELSHTIIMEIYDTLLMSNKKKLINSYNIDYLNYILQEDIDNRYKSWITNGLPILYNLISGHMSTKKIIQVINEYEELCMPEHCDHNGDTALIIACYHELEKIVKYMINTYGDLCMPQQIGYAGDTALLIACIVSEKIAIHLYNSFGEKCLPLHKNKDGLTAMDCANRNEHMEIFTILTHR